MKHLKTYESFNTDNFKQWFGNSKMVDENGQPKVFYHGVGRAGKFDTFNKDLISASSGNHGHFGVGFYFTDENKTAKGFSEFFGGTGDVMSVYLKMENPFYVNEENLIELGEKYELNLPSKVDMGIDINDLLSKLKNIDSVAYELLSCISKHDDYKKGWEEFLSKYNGEIPESKLDLNTVADWYEDTIIEKYGSGVSDYTIEELRNIGIEPKIIRGYDENIRMDYLTDLGQSATACTDAIKKEGYDGIVAGDEFVIFEPNQVKSVDNKGSFSKNNNSIYESSDNDNFIQWFGNSKVVNTDGSPKIMYHGSPNLKNIVEFKPKGNKQWYFFSDSEAEAWRYSGHKNENIGKFYIRAEKIFNPIELSDDEKVKVNKFLDDNSSYLIKQYSKDILSLLDEDWEHYDKNLTNSQIEELHNSDGGWVVRMMNTNDIVKHLFYYNLDNYLILESDLMQEFIKSNGYDSFTTLESGGNDFNIAVYSPNQIKSVNNKGSFSKNNDSIYESNGKKGVIAYHGTPNGGFDSFSYDFRGTGADEKSVGDYGKGFYFTPNKEEAIAYAHGLTENGVGENPYLYTVELYMRKPFDMTIMNRHRDLTLPLMRKYGIMNIPDEEYDKVYAELGISEEDFDYMTEIEDQIGDNWVDWDFDEILGEKGFDSMISHAGNEYIVFEPEQIKILNKEPV